MRLITQEVSQRGSISQTCCHKKDKSSVSFPFFSLNVNCSILPPAKKVVLENVPQLLSKVICLFKNLNRAFETKRKRFFSSRNLSCSCRMLLVKENVFEFTGTVFVRGLAGTIRMVLVTRS